MSGKYYIETQHGKRIDGPYSTRDDALRARFWIERVMKPETFWVRSESESHALDYRPTGGFADTRRTEEE